MTLAFDIVKLADLSNSECWYFVFQRIEISVMTFWKSPSSITSAKEKCKKIQPFVSSPLIRETLTYHIFSNKICQHGQSSNKKGWATSTQ